MSTNMEPRLHPMKFLKNITLFMLIPLRSLSVFSVRKIIGHRLLPTNNKILSQPQPLFGTTNSEERSPNLDTSNTYLADHSQTNAYGILNFVTILWGTVSAFYIIGYCVSHILLLLLLNRFTARRDQVSFRQLPFIFDHQLMEISCFLNSLFAGIWFLVFKQ